MIMELIRIYLDGQGGKKEISPEWRKNTENLIIRFLTYLEDPPEKTTTRDILRAMGKLRKSKYKENYKRQLINAGRSFSLWLANSNPSIDKSEIESIKLPKLQWKTKRPEDMLTPEELSTIIQSVKSPRDKCLISMLYDGSNRPIELLRLKWQDIVFDTHGAYFITDAKTDKERRIRLTNISLGYLEQWKKHHPKPAKDQHVFCTINATEKGIRPLTIDNVQRMMKLIRRDTGIKKVKASIFRPSRITADVASGVELPYIMKKNWGSLRTKMIDIYTNLSADYMDDTALRHAGMERKKEQIKKSIYKVEPPICPSCQSVNLIGSHFCNKCMTPLTSEGQQQVQTGEQRVWDLFQKFMQENPAALQNK